MRQLFRIILGVLVVTGVMWAPWQHFGQPHLQLGLLAGSDVTNALMNSLSLPISPAEAQECEIDEITDSWEKTHTSKPAPTCDRSTYAAACRVAKSLLPRAECNTECAAQLTLSSAGALTAIPCKGRLTGPYTRERFTHSGIQCHEVRHLLEATEWKTICTVKANACTCDP